MTPMTPTETAAGIAKIMAELAIIRDGQAVSPPPPPIVPPSPPSPPVVPPPVAVDTSDPRVAITATTITTPDDVITLFPLGNGFVVKAGETRTWATVDDTRYDTVRVEAGGVLKFARAVDTRMRATNLLVLPGGTLDLGTAADPIAAKCEVIVNDVPLSDASSGQYSNGLICLGTFLGRGNVVTPWVELAAEPLAGANTLTLVSPPVGWAAGQKLVLPDSRQLYWEIRPDNPSNATSYVSQTELATIQSVSGNIVTLAAPLQFDHKGGRDPDGLLVFMPHVANLTRNVVVKSENASGTRGHCFFTRRAWIDVEGVQFSGLGRTTNAVLGAANHVGRYAVHCHHLYGPASAPAGKPQFNFSNNSVFCPLQPMPFRWGVALHDSHYGRVVGNVVYNWAGAGIVTSEEGNETGNIIEGNFVCRVTGAGGAGQPYGRSMTDTGTEGVGIWSRSNSNFIRNNIVADCHKSYSNWSEGVNAAHVPTGPGADTGIQFSVVNMEGTALAEFRGNECYGGITAVGLSIYNVGMKFYTPWPDIGESVIKDFKPWHVYDMAYYNYKTNRLTFDGLDALADHTILAAGRSAPVGLFAGDYIQENFTLRNSRIQGFLKGIDSAMGRNQVITDTYLRNYKNIVLAPQWWLLSAANLPARDVTITRPTFVPVPAVSRSDWGAKANIFLDGRAVSRNTSFVKADVVRLVEYLGHNYRLYWPEQAANFILPQSTIQTSGFVEIEGAPVANLTNAQAFAQRGIAFAGSIVPSTATSLPGVIGSVVLE